MDSYRERPESASRHFAENHQLPMGRDNAERFLMTSFHFIGDAVLTLSGVEQIRQHSPEAEVDILCTPLQAELLSDDPRVDQLLAVLTPYPAGTPLWKRLKAPNAMIPDLKQTLRQRRYRAVFPGNMTLPFDRSLGAEVMLPSLSSFTNDVRMLRRLEDRPMGYLVRKTVDNFFGIEDDPGINQKTKLFLDPKWMY